MSRDRTLPAHQLAAVVTALYARADDVGWSTLTPQERTRHYAEWVETPDVGKILAAYMTPEKARTWIKDGPMKEYVNASRGTGRYARFGRHGGTGPTDVAAAALGPAATVVPGSQGVKPPHCLAEDPAGTTSYLAWGEAGNFRNLLWAALRAAVVDGLPAHVVVLEPPGRPTPSADIKTHRAMAQRCDLGLHYLPEVAGRLAGPVPAGDADGGDRDQ
ncbi:hypothetical protein [Geodermatophilus sp. CPCC 206100]|uniref:hypothetical protein n=1 Tax=Geodermatophilus sp. CPCC 206100 TaxID=3020054 RepID=UPI003B00900E